MKRYLKLYRLFIKYSFVRAMIYKENFIIWSLVTIGWFFINLIFYEFIYLNVNEIAGWTKPHLLILLGINFILDFFIWGILGQNMRELPEKINKGTLDLDLVKPINTQFILSFRRIGLDDLHSAAFGIITIIYAMRLGNIHPSIMDILLAGIMVTIGCIYVYSAWFITMCMAFWVDRVSNLHWLFPSLRQFWRVPQPFYQGLLRRILTFIIPITLVTTLPTQLLISSPKLIHVLVLGFFSVMALFMSHWVLQISLKHYSSASS